MFFGFFLGGCLHGFSFVLVFFGGIPIVAREWEAARE
jgi:hypothetical protein